VSEVQAELASAVIAGTPLFYVALGELLGERVGILNIGLEGIMLVGAAIGFIVAFKTESVPLSLLAAMASGLAFTLVFFAVPVLLLRTSQVLVGFCLWLLGIGLSGQVGDPYAGKSLQIDVNSFEIPLLKDIPFFGRIFFEQIWPVYLAVFLAIAAALVLRRTRHGLNMRAIGEDPDAARAVGISVRRWQAFYIAICGALGGLGGAIFSVVVAGNWQDQETAGRGWIALALVVVAAWKPLRLLWASFVFGGFLIISNVGQAHGWGIPAPILNMAPYLVAVVILVERSWRELRARERSAPAALGKVT
jgi:general nucleoside transport system permease protein